LRILENGQLFSFSKRFDWEEEFAGYSKHVREVFLTETILKALGFIQNGDKRDYYIEGITIKSIGGISGDDIWNLQYTDYGWYILPQHAVIQTEEDLKNYTCIRTLHALQNYLIDRGIQLDYSVLRW